MESSTLCKDANKARTPRKVLKSFSLKSHQGGKKNVIEDLEKKNKSGGQQMTPRSRSNGFPSLRGGIDWWRW
jgi:hypothetical protein